MGKRLDGIESGLPKEKETRRREEKEMKQKELAEMLGVSNAYISMVLSGRRQPSKRIAKALSTIKVNQNLVKSEAKMPILSHARLPVPALPRTHSSLYHRSTDFKYP
jgi:transcriptional regulator with XRE-family HTH domain